jgi:hypothetical protein
MKAEAKKSGAQVILKDEDFGLGGKAVYVVPKGETLNAGNEEKYKRAWMMEIGKECEC